MGGCTPGIAPQGTPHGCPTTVLSHPDFCPRTENPSQKSVPSLSRLGELLNTQKNVHAGRPGAVPGGPPGLSRTPRPPGSVGGPGGVAGGSRGDPLGRWRSGHSPARRWPWAGGGYPPGPPRPLRGGKLAGSHRSPPRALGRRGNPSRNHPSPCGGVSSQARIAPRVRNPPRDPLRTRMRASASTMPPRWAEPAPPWACIPQGEEAREWGRPQGATSRRARNPRIKRGGGDEGPPRAPQPSDGFSRRRRLVPSAPKGRSRGRVESSTLDG